jgi:hypothetical protein
LHNREAAGGRFESGVNFDSWSAYAQQNHLCGRSGRCPFQAQLIGNRLLDNGTLEETWVVARVQHCGIGERELAKILFGDEALLDHLEYLSQDLIPTLSSEGRESRRVKS